MKRKVEGIPRNEVALTFHSMEDVSRAKYHSCLAFDYVYVGERTLVVPADTVERYRRLHPVVSEVISASELPAEETTIFSRTSLEE